MASSNIKDNYILSRNPSSSCRLNAQHYLWFDGAPLFDHRIPTQRENIRVAEIGVGTAIWLIQAARELPPSAQLDGLDISFAAAPPEKWLPNNIKFITKDFLEPISDTDELAGIYDIVHLQHFVTVVKNGDPVPVLRNALKLLKPGGHIIWAEWDYTVWHDVYVSENPEPDDLHKQLFEYASTMGNTVPRMHSGWPARLTQNFVSEGLVNATMENRVFPPELILPVMDTLLTATDEQALALDKRGGTLGDGLRDLLVKVVERRRQVGINFGRLTAIGQKPTIGRKAASGT